MSERLYYQNAYLTDFDAIVTAVEPAGERSTAVLSRTAFYPTSGGQPHDTGTLNGLEVVDVRDREDGVIEHVVDGSLEPGEVVRGCVEWTRRFDHMQQHTGQHVLSAAFDRRAKARTVSFHLGAESATIDLDRDLPADRVALGESEANRVVWENRPVGIRFVTAEEAATLPLRKEPARAGLLRLIEVEDFDLSACGGTHVARTGAIGVIAVLGTERFKGGTRVEFVCGARALRSFRAFRRAIDGSVRLLSVLPGELPEAITRLQTDVKDLKRVQKGLGEKIAVYEAQALAARGVPSGGVTTVIEAVDGYDAPGLKALAAAIVATGTFAVALFSTTSPVLAVVARSSDVEVNAADVLQVLLARFGGRGGGKPELAQGGGLVGATEDLLTAARDELRR